jgi:hypothetical protein
VSHTRTRAGLEPGDDPQRWVPGGDIKMVTLDIGVEAAQGRNYSWLRAVRWSQPETLLSTIEADGKPVPKVCVIGLRAPPPRPPPASPKVAQ